MGEEEAEELSRRLAAELSAALPARRSAVEFARHFIGDKDPGLTQSLQALRSADARLSAASSELADNRALLARMAVTEAEAMEAELPILEDWVKPEALGGGKALVRVVAGLLWEARYGEGRAKAWLSARRKRLALPGFDDALELAPENELLFLALRRFSRLLHAGGEWPRADQDWLRLRSVTLPGRLRLHAAELRSLAESAAGIALPQALLELRRPFVQFGYEPGPALAWGVAGFNLSEALVWGAAGLPWAAQALAWRAWGHSAHEAAAWAAADLLPDEAAAFKACGALDPATARRLRQALGDVENLLAWHRAGFDTAEVLRMKADGITDVEAALKAKKEAAAKAFPSAPVKEEPLKVSMKELLQEEPAAERKDEASKPAKRAKAPTAAVGAEGGAWIGWAVHEAVAGELERPRSLTLSRPLGPGLLDIVSESEAVALLSAPASLPELRTDPEWQAQLDWHRQAQGREAQPGAWLLAGLAPLRARLYWGLIFKTPAAPWGTAIDFDATETWSQRWKRRCEEWSEPGLACPCEVLRAPSGGWCIEARGSRQEQGGAQPLRLERLLPEDAWVESVEKFCLMMGIGKHAPGWCLLAVEA